MTTHHPSDDGVRLARRVAELRACSRTEAEQLIAGGCVRVDGQVVETPQFRVSNQTVEIDPDATATPLLPVSLLLHKPVGLDAGTGVPVDIKGVGKGLRPALDLLRADTQAPSGRGGPAPLNRHFAGQTLYLALETGASGLIVFSQDWRIQRRLLEDAAIIEQEFTVDVDGVLTPEALAPLNRPGQADSRLPSFKASITSASDTATRLRFAVKGSHPGLIAWLCDRAGLQITAMKRIRIGRVPMADLPVGQWRYLMPYERF